MSHWGSDDEDRVPNKESTMCDMNWLNLTKWNEYDELVTAIDTLNNKEVLEVVEWQVLENYRVRSCGHDV